MLCGRLPPKSRSPELSPLVHVCGRMTKLLRRFQDLNDLTHQLEIIWKTYPAEGYTVILRIYATPDISFITARYEQHWLDVFVIFCYVFRGYIQFHWHLYYSFFVHIHHSFKFLSHSSNTFLVCEIIRK